MSPFPSFFFNKKNNDQNDPILNYKSTEVAGVWGELNMKKPKSSTEPAARSLPILSGSHVPGFAYFQEPEEEVFSLSLETEQSPAWPYMDSTSSSSGSMFNLSRLISPLKALGEEERKSRPSVTPGASRDGKRKRVGSPPAPKKLKNRGRAEELQRYIHKYECEDMMEYAVDTHHWKVSLEESYQPDNWEVTQLEITPGMRLSLLDWLVTVTRTLDLSLETWCLAVNYLDRFLCSQLIGKDCLQLVGLTALWLGAKQEELLPPSLEQLVALTADTFTTINFQHMELLILAKLKFRLAAPTAAYHLHHLIAVEEEEDWSEDLSRHLVEIIMEDHILARERPSKIAHAVYQTIKEFDLTAVQILESSCPRCEPHNADIWSEELFQMCLQRVMQALTF